MKGRVKLIKLNTYTTIILLLLLIFLVLPGCNPGEDVKLTEQHLIRIGYLQNDLHQLAFYVAQQRGFYEDAGLTVEVAGIYKSGVELMAAFQSGVLDAGYVGLAPVTVAVANGKAEVTVVAQANQVGSALVVRRELTINSPEELNGLKIAVPNVGTVQDFLLNRALDSAGLKISDIKKVIMPPPEMISAMISGGIDGCVVWEPYAAEMEAGGHGKVMTHSDEIWKDHPCCVLAVDRLFLQEQQAEALALLEAHRRATEYILNYEEEALELAVEFTGLSPEVVQAAMNNIDFNYHLNVESAVIYARYLTKQGIITVSDHTEFIGSFIDVSLLKEGGN